MRSLKNITYGRYSIRLGILILLLAAVSLALGWIYFGLHAWITFLNVLIIWIILVFILFYQVRRGNRDLARFFELFHDRESLHHFDLVADDPLFAGLHKQMNLVIGDLSTIQSEKERDYQFFKTIFDHADVGLLVYDENEKIVLINKSASLFLGAKSPVMETIRTIRPGIKTLLKVEQGGNTVLLSVRAGKIKVSDKSLTLLSMQNIRQELEQHEIESWQKLIRVFIHEILNSVSPITLTSTGIIALLEQPKSPTNEQRTEIINGLKAIRKRSKGISAFMESYRQLSGSPVPDFNWVHAGRLVENVGRLMMQDFIKGNIRFSIHLSPRDIRIWCDEKLAEQVLINLLHNAAEALISADDPEIRLSCVSLFDRVEITVKDNGPGIDQEIHDNIFVPFFTTKSDGTGIGLSLSRQIMNLHRGSIFVNSKPGDTSFTLSFPNIPTLPHL